MSESATHDKTWTVRDVLRWMTDRFASIEVSSPRLDAELLCARALGCDRIGIYLNMDRPLTGEERRHLRELARRRISREPVAYILGTKEFYGLSLKVTPDVLIPRPDTETLVEVVLNLHGGETSLSVLEIGTGSGAITLALAHRRPEWSFTATDISEAALDVASNNAQRLEMNIEFLSGDRFFPVSGRTFDLIVSNPPYIPDNILLQEEIRHEPAIALFAGSRGLDVLADLIRSAPDHLARDGRLLLEFGDGQEDDLSAMAREMQTWDDLRLFSDLSGRPRVLALRKT